jgi:hypothetical protein
MDYKSKVGLFSLYHVISTHHCIPLLITQTGERRVLFDADSEEGKKVAPKGVDPEEKQESNESRRYVASFRSSLY